MQQPDKLRAAVRRPGCSSTVRVVHTGCEGRTNRGRPLRGEDQMTSTLDREPANRKWEPPNPGPWQQDSAHNPVAQTALLQHAYPDGFDRGFEEAFSLYGVLLVRLARASISGFTCRQVQPFDLPVRDGPRDPAWIE